MLRNVPCKSEISALRLFKRYSSREGKKNVVFFGSDDFSIASLNALWKLKQADNSIGNLSVISSAKPLIHKKRGVILPPVLEFAKKVKIDVLDWCSIKQHRKLEKDYEVGFVASFGEFIPSSIINQFSRGIVNIHPSLLPRWRGAAPIVHTILSGDTTTGVTFIKLSTHKFDVGNILLQEKVEIPDDCDNEHLRFLLARKSADMIVHVWKNFDELMKKSTPQNNNLATNAPKVRKTTGVINFERDTCCRVDRLKRALPKSIGVRGYWLTKQVVFKTILQYLPLSEEERRLENGVIKFDSEQKVLNIKLSDGWIVVKTLQVECKKEIRAIDFFNGYVIDKKTGSISNTRFTTSKTS